MAHNFFNLAGLREIRGGAGSRWMRLIPNAVRGGNPVPLDPQVRGVLSRQQNLALRAENVVKDADLEQGVAALSMLGGGLQNAGFPLMMQPDRVNELIVAACGDAAADANIFGMDIEINVGGLFNGWPGGFPVQPANNIVFFNAAHWTAWLALLRGNNNMGANNNPQACPQAVQPQPVINEFHPWALAGFHNLNVQTGAAVANRAGALAAILEVVLIVGLRAPQGARRRQDIMNLLVIGTTILTSGGNITQGKLRKITQASAREMMIEVDMTRDMIQRGWDFINAQWQGAQIGADFQEFFRMLGQSTQPICLRLSLMCQQTEWKMLTGIVTVIRTINAFQDFPWQNLCDVIRNLTGRNEAAVVADFADYIDPAVPANPPGAGGHWAGWEFGLRTQNQGMRKNPEFINLLYAALQLSIQAGGNLSLRGYAALDNATVPAKLVIDTWIAAYINARGGNANPYPNAPAAVGAEIQMIRAHNI